MKKRFILLTLMACMFFGKVFAQDYNTMWNKVEALQDDDKPRSVIEEAEKIYNKAKDESNFAQMIKAKICIIEKQCDLDPELFAPDEYEKAISDLNDNNNLTAEDKAARLALSHCMLASAYNSMHDSYVHDFDEETREEFPKKAKEHIFASLADMETLAKVDAHGYEPLVEFKDDSRLFAHDVLHTILRSAMESSFAWLEDSEKVDLYNRAIKVYEQMGRKDAVALLTMRMLNVRRNSRAKAVCMTVEDYREAMKALLEQTKGEEMAVDVANGLAAVYSDNDDERLAFIRSAIEIWKDNPRVKNLQAQEAYLMATHINIETDEKILAARDFGVHFRYSNATKATLTVREYAGAKSYNELNLTGKVLMTRQYDLPLDAENQQRKANRLPTSGTHDDVLRLPAGHYVLIAETDGDKKAVEVRITSLRMVSVGLPNEKDVKVLVLDDITGRPVANASVLLFKTWDVEYGKKPDQKLKTDDKGEVIIKDLDYKVHYMVAVRDYAKYGTPAEDCTQNLSPRKSYGNFEKSLQTRLSAYTDRGIYRPGQTVHGAAIEYTQKGDTVAVKPNSSVQVTVKDPNYKDIYKEYYKTNEYGSLSFEFTLPADAKLGAYHVQVRDGQNYTNAEFHVEEYKRPTFEVLFDEKQAEVKHQLGDLLKVVGSAEMLTGVPNQGAEVEYTVSWAEAHRWFYHPDWQELTRGETTTADDGTFEVSVLADVPQIVYCDSIAFRIKAMVTDQAGEMQMGEFTFKVKNPNYRDIKDDDKKADEPKDELSFSNVEISETQDAVVSFSAKEKDALVYYFVTSKDKVEMEGSKVLNGDELKFTVKYKKEWGDGVTVSVFYVRNGHMYYSGQSLAYVRPDKQLKLAWKTFRDNLIPGQKEEWVLTVKDAKGRSVPGAELMAVMYDASLDRIYDMNWAFKVSFDRQLPGYFLVKTFGNTKYELSLNPNVGNFYVAARKFDQLQAFMHSRWYRVSHNHNYGMVMMESAVAPRRMAKASVMAEAMVGSQEASDEAVAVDGAEAEVGAQSIRTNLEELAFFYPHLTTDDRGEAHIAFTLPDCLTEWKFMGVVHTKDVDFGSVTAKATAKKDFMVQPNMPRFFRTGDKAEVNAKITNMCDKAVSGTATMRILDAETEQVVLTRTADFATEAGQATSVGFPLEVTLAAGDYICEITATDGTMSDGERNRLPVLSTRVDVVENVPFYLDGASTKQVDLSAIYNGGSATATDKQLTIGYTDNPALPVFESLRALQNPEHDNAPCYAAALYSNLVMLDMSKVLGDRLKEFDADKAQATADNAIEKLKKLQLASGAWTWFVGMSASYYITLSVATNLSRLQSYLNRHEQKCPAEVDKMLKKALKYLDKEEWSDYKRRKKMAKDYPSILRPTDSDIQYLAISTDANQEMVNTYLEEMNKDFKNLTIFGRSQGVTIMKKFGKDKWAKRCLESVKEYTVYKEGFGRYFATDLAYYSWMDYRIPTQLAAMRAVKALPGTERNFLLDMQLWLLRQKQTQVWGNPINALDVADFLLTDNADVSLHEVTIPTLDIDGRKYVQDSVYNDIDKVQTLTVTKTSPGVSWGHVRGMFREEASNLNSYTTGELTIERKVIREGKKVTVRHIIHADRDMDFVTVKSQHAACLEPMRTVSGYQWMGGRGCYLEVHDSYINLFFDKFTRGTTTIDMEYYIAREGEYDAGYASVECSYAPEFGGHSKGEKFVTGN